MQMLKLKILNEVFYDESIKLEVRLLRLVALYTVAAIVLAVPCFMVAGYDGSAYTAAGVSLFILAGVFGVYLYTKDIGLVSILFCYTLNIIILPLIFIYTGGIYGGIEFLFLCGLVDGLFLL
ncbi:MAG: hypothetical protein J5966_04580, partial [Lachnospiraceae bacterium]|nr:hypothetical protein [Lachnospiraceae bacterium]